ncbi:zinc-ribbon domain-containing protein [Paracoccus onubensis]|nr:zinc-ribbon domain-containing protein [Paracoccus onubensis]
MGEIRLQCPECGTEYHLPEGVIPKEGRQVECTSCDHVWLAIAEKRDSPDSSEDMTVSTGQLDEGDKSGIIRYAAPRGSDSGETEAVNPSGDFETPPLARRIPESVLNILREEVEFERRARRAEITENSSDQPDHDWPATTITDAGPTPDIRDLPHSIPLDDPQPEQLPEPVAPSAGIAAISTAPAESGGTTIARKRAQNGGYLTGFGTALAVAAVAFGLYVIAPDFADNDRFGAQLSQYREMVDTGRDWLQTQTSRLTQSN